MHVYTSFPGLQWVADLFCVIISNTCKSFHEVATGLIQISFCINRQQRAKLNVPLIDTLTHLDQFLGFESKEALFCEICDSTSGAFIAAFNIFVWNTASS